MWPKATEFGFPDEEAAFALQMGHGIGLAIWEKPMISRLVSLEHPARDQARNGVRARDVLAATDGWSAARIEEEIVVTETGHEVITRFPAEELLVAGAPFVTVRAHCRPCARPRRRPTAGQGNDRESRAGRSRDSQPSGAGAKR